MRPSNAMRQGQTLRACLGSGWPLESLPSLFSYCSAVCARAWRPGWWGWCTTCRAHVSAHEEIRPRFRCRTRACRHVGVCGTAVRSRAARAGRHRLGGRRDGHARLGVDVVVGHQRGAAARRREHDRWTCALASVCACAWAARACCCARRARSARTCEQHRCRDGRRGRHQLPAAGAHTVRQRGTRIAHRASRIARRADSRTAGARRRTAFGTPSPPCW